MGQGLWYVKIWREVGKELKGATVVCTWPEHPVSWNIADYSRRTNLDIKTVGIRRLSSVRKRPF